MKYETYFLHSKSLNVVNVYIARKIFENLVISIINLFGYETELKLKACVMKKK